MFFSFFYLVLSPHQLEAQSGFSEASTPEGREERGAVDPWVGEAQVAAPLSREEGGQEMGGKMPDPPAKEVGMPRPQEPEETVLALGAIPPLGDASLEGQGQLEQTEGSRAEEALIVVPPETSRGKGSS